MEQAEHESAATLFSFDNGSNQVWVGSAWAASPLCRGRAGFNKHSA